MSETLSDEELNEIERWIPEANPNGSDWPLRHVIASYRALRQERDALKDDLATILKERNDLAMRCDALKAELAKMRQLLEIAKELIKHP